MHICIRTVPSVNLSVVGYGINKSICQWIFYMWNKHVVNISDRTNVCVLGFFILKCLFASDFILSGQFLSSID